MTSPRGGPSRIRSRRDTIPSESSLSSSPSPPSSSLGDSSSGSPLCLDLARRASSAWRSRFLFFSPFFLESLADFSFSADCLSRSTSSSFTGGLEDRTSIRPCQNKGRLRKREERNLESKLCTIRKHTRSIEPASGLMGKSLTCSGLKSPAIAALTQAATSSFAEASLDIRHASRSRDETPGPILSILNGRDINGRTLR